MRSGYQQGDVLLIEVDLPSDAVPVAPKPRGVVVAEGEATGHAHVLDPEHATEYQLGGRRFVTVSASTPLTHEEHDPVQIAPRTYEIDGVVEKDWLADAVRPVVD